MKRLLALPALVVGALALAAFAFANPGHGNKQPHPNKATVLIHTTDGSCSGGTWADDTIMRTIKVHKNKDGSYRIREQDKGFFSTNAGGAIASPGNCPANTSAHGHTVRLGVVGTFKGYITGQHVLRFEVNLHINPRPAKWPGWTSSPEICQRS